jgi:hypothetical protein
MRFQAGDVSPIRHEYVDRELQSGLRIRHE